MEPQQIAEQTYMNGSNCAQGVFTTFCERYGLHRETGMLLCSPLGGGIANTGSTCGAVTGALLVIGLHYGNELLKDGFNDTAKEKAHEFMQHFKDKYSSTKCKELLGYDISDPGQKEKIKADDLFNIRCPAFVVGAARILEEILENK